jgi:nitroreductase
MPSIIETMQQRSSTRTFSDQEIEKDKKDRLITYLISNTSGPFRSNVRFALVDALSNEKIGFKKLGTYGMIKGARIYIAGVVQRGEKAMEDFGYCMEKNILLAASLGLGACWLGGTLNRSAFAQRLHMRENEVLPAVTPLGYPKGKRSIQDTITRIVAGSKNRKAFPELFFKGSPENPLSLDECETYSLPLQCIRIAPSASNKQPWRVIKEKDRFEFHFYLDEDPKYNSIFKDIKIQNIDMGIALCHFESAAQELGLKGSLQVREPPIDAGKWEYCASWMG